MTDLGIMLLFFFFSFFMGFFLISRIPALLHTPLMSMTNALSAITILGAFLLFTTELNLYEKALGGVAIATACFNVVGGFIITDRMLRLFKSEKQGASSHILTNMHYRNTK